MPLDALNTLYKMAIDREKVEQAKREAEEKKRKEEEEAERKQFEQQQYQGPVHGGIAHPSWYMSRSEAEAFEDELMAEGLGL